MFTQADAATKFNIYSNKECAAVTIAVVPPPKLSSNDGLGVRYTFLNTITINSEHFSNTYH